MTIIEIIKTLADDSTDPGDWEDILNGMGVSPPLHLPIMVVAHHIRYVERA